MKQSAVINPWPARILIVAGLTLPAADLRAQASQPAPASQPDPASQPSPAYRPGSSAKVGSEPWEADKTRQEVKGGGKSAAELLTPITAEFVGVHKNFVLKFGELLTLRPGAFVQLRYTLNHRSDPGEQKPVVSAFNVPRGRIWLGVGISKYVEAFIRFGSTAQGAVRLERAFADFNLWKFRLRFGRFFLTMRLPDEYSTHFLPAMDFSSTDNVFDPGGTQGAEVRFSQDWFRGTLTISDGLRTGFTEVLDPLRADLAVSGRVEFRVLGDDWGRFADLACFPGSDGAAKVVLASHYQYGGKTGASIPLDLVYLTGGIHAEYRRFGLLLSGTWLWVDFLDIEPFWQAGFVAQLSAMVIKYVDLWARFDGTFTDGKPRPAGAEQPGLTDFRTVAGGLNFYIFPPTHRAKVQLDFQYMFDPQATSLVPTWPNNGVLATNTGAQWSIRIQTLVSF